MKTSSVRITKEQEQALQRIANTVPGASVSGLTQRAVELFLEIEGPVYLEAYKQARLRIVSKRQSVSQEAAAR